LKQELNKQVFLSKKEIKKKEIESKIEKIKERDEMRTTTSLKGIGFGVNAIGGTNPTISTCTEMANH
jgi:translation elongation factor EF-1beta